MRWAAAEKNWAKKSKTCKLLSYSQRIYQNTSFSFPALSVFWRFCCNVVMSFNIESFHSLIKGLTSTSHSMHSSELYDCIKPDLDLLRTQSMSTKIWFHTALAFFLKIVGCTKGVQQRTYIVHPSFDLLLPEVCTKHPISIQSQFKQCRRILEIQWKSALCLRVFQKCIKVHVVTRILCCSRVMWNWL